MGKRGPKPDISPYSAQESDYVTSYWQEYIKCKRESCKKCAEGGKGHGPYWYSYHYSPTRKRRIKEYIGKTLPEGIERPTGAD